MTDHITHPGVIRVTAQDRLDEKGYVLRTLTVEVSLDISKEPDFDSFVERLKPVYGDFDRVDFKLVKVD